jgi:O-methyltransferase
MVQIRRAATAARGSSIELLAGSQDEIARLRDDFAQRHTFKLPGLLGPELLEEISAQLAAAEFEPTHHEDFQFGHAGAEEDVGYVEATLKDEEPAVMLLRFLINDPRLFELVEEITGCERIGRFDGRVYRMEPSAYSGWHDDIGDNRMVAMSLNLGTQSYDGGVLQLRETASRRLVAEAPNTGPGDAIFFRVAEDLQHQITPVEGEVAKTAFAGWFKSADSGPFLAFPARERAEPPVELVTTPLRAGAENARRPRLRPPRSLAERWRHLRLRGLPEPLRTVWPHTLLTPLNLLFLVELATRATRLGVPGDFVECGVYKGGSAGVLGYSMTRLNGGGRKLWLYDSFEGLPAAGPNDGELDRQLEGDYAGSESEVRRILERLGVPPERFEIVSGRFEQTFDRVETTAVALLHIDCDFYEPVRLSLETFFPRVSPGGFVVLNDYGTFPGCRAATDEFLAHRGLELEPTFIDHAAVFFQKPPAAGAVSLAFGPGVR